MVAHAAVRDVPEAELGPPVAVRASALTLSPAIAPGEREQNWQPTGETRQSPIPQAVAGTRSGEETPAVRLGNGSGAFAPSVCREMPAVQAAEARTESADLLLPAFVVRLPDSFLALPPAPVRVRAATLLTPGTVRPARALEGWAVPAPPCRALRLPRVSGPRIRAGSDAVLSRIALTRRGLEPPPGVSFALAFRREEQRLAEAAHLPPEDVTLLGVYPGVPILAVSRLVVAEEGRLLRLWLKPDVLRGRNGTRLITLLVGRHSSGKTLQASL